MAIEGNFASYEYILEGLFRLQIGFDKGRIETGILMLTSERSEKSRLGTSVELAKVGGRAALSDHIDAGHNCPV